jgi:2-dehydro-3-deoxyphosphogalactonate aldolase
MSATTPWPKLGCGLVAILRGVKPDEAVDVARSVHHAGIEAIEVPLNSPDPFRSIEAIVKALPGALVGAGTVLTAEDVDRLAGAGGRLLVSPNVDATVLERAHRRAMVTMPGVFTPTECFAALKAGASALKFFPASVIGPGGIAAIRTVLPGGTQIAAVGGVSDSDFATYKVAGVGLFGLGSSLYKAGSSAAETGSKAMAAVATWRRIFGEGL